MARKLKVVPLVESIFELRWGAGDGVELHREYGLALGRLYERLAKRDFSVRRHLASLPEELYSPELPPQHLVFERFLLKGTDASISYPLVQIGPGVATYNTDNGAYDWPKMLSGCMDLHRDLSDVVRTLDERLDDVILRSIDLFPLESPDQALQFLRSKLRAEVATALSENPTLAGATVQPTYDVVWNLKESSTRLHVRASHGRAGDREGLVLDIQARASRPFIRERGVGEAIKHLHELTGDAFFGLLGQELRDELGYHEV